MSAEEYVIPKDERWNAVKFVAERQECRCGHAAPVKAEIVSLEIVERPNAFPLRIVCELNDQQLTDLAAFLLRQRSGKKP